MKPMKAENYVEDKLVFPLGAQPKIDGVRGLNMTGAMTSRSLKPFGNRYTNEFYSKPEYVGFDGELAAEDERHPSLCRLTTSATSTIVGQPFTLWHLFDFVTASTAHRAYEERYHLLSERLAILQAQRLAGTCRLVPMHVCRTLEELLYWDQMWLEMGYEGTIIRRLDAPHKQGKSTVKEGGLLRIKRFVEEEAQVLAIIEGRTNLNEQQTNELGRSFRSSHQDNQVPNGMVGSLLCLDVKTQKEIIVSAGSMPHDERLDFFLHPEKILKQYIKYKTFPKGVKDKPRFPTYVTIRPKDGEEFQ